MREATVVGVVAHARLAKVDDTPRATLFWPLSQLPNSFMTVVVRAKGKEGSLARASSAIRESVAALDPTVPAAKIESMSDVLDRAVQRPRFSTSLLALFAGSALLLAALGIYGLLAGAVAERQRELGVPLVLLSGRWLRELLFELEPTDPLSLAAAPLVLLFVAALASAVPALRAARTDPATVLREG